MEGDVAVEIGLKRHLDQDFSYNQFIRNYPIILTAHIRPVGVTQEDPAIPVCFEPEQRSAGGREPSNNATNTWSGALGQRHNDRAGDGQQDIGKGIGAGIAERRDIALGRTRYHSE